MPTSDEENIWVVFPLSCSLFINAGQSPVSILYGKKSEFMNFGRREREMKMTSEIISHTAAQFSVWKYDEPIEFPE